MPTTFTFYLQTGNPVAHLLLPSLVQAVKAKYPATMATPTNDGVGWVACDLASDRDVASEMRALYPGRLSEATTTSPVPLRISSRPEEVRRAVEHGMTMAGPDALGVCDALAELTPNGYALDWSIVKAVHSAAVELWNAIAYTDQAGFDVKAPD